MLLNAVVLKVFLSFCQYISLTCAIQGPKIGCVKVFILSKVAHSFCPGLHSCSSDLFDLSKVFHRFLLFGRRDLHDPNLRCLFRGVSSLYQRFLLGVFVGYYRFSLETLFLQQELLTWGESIPNFHHLTARYVAQKNVPTNSLDCTQMPHFWHRQPAPAPPIHTRKL